MASLRITLVAALLIALSCGRAPSGTGQLTRNQVSLGNGITLVLETRPFHANRHEVKLCAGGIPCLIDGKPVFGTHGSMPSLEVVSLTLHAEGRQIPLDASAMYNPWSPREDRQVHVWLSRQLPDRIVVRGEFSDGAAAYVAEWEVIEGVSLRTVLKCAECLSMSCRGFEEGDE